MIISSALTSHGGKSTLNDIYILKIVKEKKDNPCVVVSKSRLANYWVCGFLWERFIEATNISRD
jgi:hypothetical protein